MFRHASGKQLLMLQTIYGGGLRVSDLFRLRVKDLDFANCFIHVRGGKGDKDRTTFRYLDLLFLNEAFYRKMAVVPNVEL